MRSNCCVFFSKTSEGGNESRDRDRNRRNDRIQTKATNNQRDRSPLGGRARKNVLERRVYVSNIPYEYRWQDLKDLFRNEGKLSAKPTVKVGTISNKW